MMESSREHSQNHRPACESLTTTETSQLHSKQFDGEVLVGGRLSASASNSISSLRFIETIENCSSPDFPSLQTSLTNGEIQQHLNISDTREALTIVFCSRNCSVLKHV
ncbi:hypothetical protein KIN20_030155 [Parelaphostrongylus tenuis]|uniref:Uncharacterized protein n=1 Tax=Parelaphostrongylus tenuis TaxID=148309 RepID=A0AAD5R3F6_PARTN|nr:hypothetical protein KIN20_030155 [Parelaphostrongylus tenuis]